MLNPAGGPAPAAAHVRRWTPSWSLRVNPDGARVVFTLFIAGDSMRSRLAEDNVRRLGDEQLAGRYDLAVVDVTTDPGAAEQHRILTTPTLLKESPGPRRRVTGDLSDATQVMYALALPARHSRT